MTMLTHMATPERSFMQKVDSACRVFNDAMWRVVWVLVWMVLIVLAWLPLIAGFLIFKKIWFLFD